MGTVKSWRMAVLAAATLAGGSLQAQAADYSMTFLGLPDGAVSSVATALNDVGQVVGQAYYADGSWVNVVWSGSSVTLLDAPAQFKAEGINNAGVIVGSTGRDPTLSSVYMINGGVTTALLGPRNYPVYGPASINNLGQIYAANQYYGLNGVEWNSATPTANGVFAKPWRAVSDNGYYISSTPGKNATSPSGSFGRVDQLAPIRSWNGTAEGINDAGEVVGMLLSGHYTTDDYVSTYWSGDGTAVSVISLLSAADIAAGTRIGSALDINNNGWIVGTGYNPLTGKGEAYILSPLAAVPEASTVSMLACGALFGAVLYRRRTMQTMRATLP